ncbi:MAG: Glycosyl hydrolase family 10 [candidate division WS6 bacterium OLB20]|uniref:Glycosyl hydrolase family 10 n=1 Tax=candidate division WS6 bacterium OLB20 TaxID=1617426 RepID=A0A136LZ07_9BACT|nr:MAG: Glycosyl hydrolase family 10 [candidate division WS6 bacterium OLB20]
MATRWGITFSQKYCRELGLDPGRVLHDLLADFPFSALRVCAYWDEIEQEPHLFDFTELDSIIKTAAEAECAVTVAAGRKVPRWPEYHEPAWALDKGEHYLAERSIYFIENVVNHYRDNSAVVRWQIENEPFWQFGHSEFPLTEEYVNQAVAAVRRLDDRPVLMTDTAEHSRWRKAALYGDEVGINIYPASYARQLRRYQYPGIDPANLKEKIAAAAKPVLVTELQAEPWGPSERSHLPPDSIEEQIRSMSPMRLRENIQAVRTLPVTEIWLWGAEWWYQQKQNERPLMYETARELLAMT